MIAPWRLFAVVVRRVQPLSPTFLRVTVTGADLDAFADNGFDQRIKLVLPVPGRGLADLPAGPDWYGRWRSLPDEGRPPFRTYTARSVRQQLREVDVDMVRHHGTGPASRFAATARPGDRLGIIGPDVRFPGGHGGVEFQPPAATGALLLAGDETAVPAICAILERLPARAHGEALLEIPERADALAVGAPPGMRVSWMPRSGSPHGSRLVPAVMAAAFRLPVAPAPVGPCDLADIDVDAQPLWEVPTGPVGNGRGAAAGPYVWLAGEAGVIRTLRRQLVAGRGLDPRSAALMGYWRLGRPECGGRPSS